MGLFLGPINLQIAHDRETGVLMLKKNKRIGNKKSHRIEHIRVALAGGIEQHGLIVA